MENFPCTAYLRDFVSESDFVMFDSCLPIDSYTYLSYAWHSTSWLDQCIGPKYLLDSLADCRIICDSFNSDHLPLSVSINIPTCNASGTAAVSLESQPLGVILPKIELHKTSRNVIDSVQSHIFDYLNATGLPELDVLCCDDTTCSSSEHKAQIDVLYSHVISCLTNAVSASIPF